MPNYVKAGTSLQVPVNRVLLVKVTARHVKALFFCFVFFTDTPKCPFCPQQENLTFPVADL